MSLVIMMNKNRKKFLLENSACYLLFIIVNYPWASGFFLMVCHGHEDQTGMKEVSTWEWSIACTGKE